MPVWGDLQYLPLGQPHFSLLTAIYFVLVAWILVRAFRLASTRVGLGSSTALMLLAASLAGSYLNIPVAQLPQQQHFISGQVISFYGVYYVVPAVADWPGTVIAVNVGGAVIPGFLSFYLLVRYRLWLLGGLAIAIVALVCHCIFSPSSNLGGKITRANFDAGGVWATH